MRADVSAKAQAEAVIKAEADAKAKADAEDKMTESQRTQAEVETLKARIAAQDAAALESARTSMLDSLGVDPAYRRVFPEGDAREPKVKAAIEKFAADHPRLLTRPPGPPQPTVPDLASKFHGRQVSKLVNTESVKASIAAMNETLGNH